MGKSLKIITVVMLDFDSLASSGDEVVVGRVSFLLQSSKRRLFPKSVQFDSAQVERAPARLTIRLLHTSKGPAPVTVGIVAFIPPTDFSQRPVMI